MDSKTAEALKVVSAKLEEAQHRAGLAKRLVSTSFYPSQDHELTAMDAVLLLLNDADDAMRAARIALDGPADTEIPF